MNLLFSLSKFTNIYWTIFFSSSLVEQLIEWYCTSCNAVQYIIIPEMIIFNVWCNVNTPHLPLNKSKILYRLVLAELLFSVLTIGFAIAICVKTPSEYENFYSEAYLGARIFFAVFFLLNSCIAVTAVRKNVYRWVCVALLVEILF